MMGDGISAIVAIIAALAIQAFIVSAAVQIFYDGPRKRMIAYATIFVAFMLLLTSISVSLLDSQRPIYAICVESPTTAPDGDEE